MRCRACNYALWGITERTCPECGTPFEPSTYEFVPGAVLFGCPHCDERYHGMDERGHPEPAAFACTGCGRAIELDDMVLRIAVAMTEAETRPGVVPWLERRHRGRLKALLQTVGMSLVAPGRLGRGIPLNASVGESIVYALVTTLTLFAIGASVPAIAWISGLGGRFGGGGGMGGTWVLLWVSIQLFFGLTVAISLFVIWPIATHAALRVTGGCRHGIDRTFQAFGYSAGANLLSAIPCFGPYVGWVWWVVSATLVVRAAQRVSGGRAFAAVLALPLVILLVGGGAVGVMYINAARSVGAALGAGFTPGTQQTLALVGAIQNQAWRDPQRAGGPDHAIELILSGMLAPGFGGTMAPFLQPGTATTAKDIPVGDGTLADFSTLSSSAQIGQIKKVLDAVPKNLVAHRVGDFVFTYHGAKLNANDANLWTVVMLPDPDVNGTPAAGDDIHIGSGGYVVTTITYGELAKELAQQNTYRATLGLVPLPDPVTVTHDKPAVATAR